MLFMALDVRPARWIGGLEYAWSHQLQAVKEGPSMGAAGSRAMETALGVCSQPAALHFLCLQQDLGHRCWVRWVPPNVCLELWRFLQGGERWLCSSAVLMPLSSCSHKCWLFLEHPPSSHHLMGTAAHPRDATTEVGVELLQTLTFPNPWESEIRPVS